MASITATYWPASTRSPTATAMDSTLPCMGARMVPLPPTPPMATGPVDNGSVAGESDLAAGMVLQATQLLMQVDWLSSGEPLWDSSWFIAEASVVGQMAYAIFGYEATPSLIELGAYSLSIIGIVFVAVFANKFGKNQVIIKSE